jgi:hypothetical protein
LSTNLSAWCTGENAFQWLSTSVEPPAVADVFPNSFYLRTASGDLINVTGKEVRSPINVNIGTGGPDFQEAVKVGERAEFGGGVLSVGPLRVAITEGRFTNSLRPEEAKKEKVVSVKGKLLAAACLLVVFDLKESILDAGGKAFDRYRSFFMDAFVRPTTFDESLFMESAYGLLGIGSGFTPSFDDFVSGFLCMYNAGNRFFRRAPLIMDIAEAERRTSWASARLLDYMQHDLMDEDVEAVVSSFFAGDGDGLLLGLEDVVSRGHSSGLDMSVGMLVASSVVLDDLDHGSFTSNLGRSMGF